MFGKFRLIGYIYGYSFIGKSLRVFKGSNKKIEKSK
jgi:hypothetical protein